jgi:SWI/SNF-related matrix-associated actin-dependent regulator of chromatin subfamily A member 5
MTRCAAKHAGSLYVANIFQDDEPQASTSKAKAKKPTEHQKKTQKRKAAEGKLQVKRQEMDKAKVRTLGRRVFRLSTRP